MDRPISQTAITKVFDAMKEEADMDGLVTATDPFLAKKTSLHSLTVFYAIHALLDRGIIEQVGRGGRGGVRMLQIKEV